MREAHLGATPAYPGIDDKQVGRKRDTGKTDGKPYRVRQGYLMLMERQD
jgi:hypothetical protein